MSADGHRDSTIGRGEALRARIRAFATRKDEAHRSADPGPRRDMTPAVGSPGGPASWVREHDGAPVALHQRDWQDGRWSSIFAGVPGYAGEAGDEVPEGLVEDANARGRSGDTPPLVQGPMMRAPVWTWEIPLYFWFGGIAAGSSFVALACDLSGDERSARVARKVALAALIPSPPLLIMDLGRPERFYNMLRIFKPRSPMSLGAWCLSVFGGLAAGSVGADILGRRQAAKVLGGANAVVGGYLGSYTGVLLAATAVPVWARSRLFLGPIFVSTATLTGAATTRLVLVASGMPQDHPTRIALARVEGGAMAAELLLSAVNEHRLGRLARALEDGRPGQLSHAAKWLGRIGLTLGATRPRGSRAHHVASVCYLASGLLFRYAWVGAGPPSAHDDEAVARTARGQATAREATPPGLITVVQHR